MLDCNDRLQFCNYSLIHFNWNNLLTCQQISIDVIVKIMCNACLDTHAWIARLMKRYSIIKKRKKITWLNIINIGGSCLKSIAGNSTPSNLLSVECKELQSFWLRATSSYENSQHSPFASLPTWKILSNYSISLTP